MTDRLTQIQDCLDQLATQFYASLRYITNHHPNSPSANNLSNPSQPPETPGQSNNNPPLPGHDPNHRPDTPTTFAAAQQELAHDLILKTKEIEVLVKSLPEVGESEREQMERIRELEGELRRVEEVRKGVVVEGKEEMIRVLEGVLGGVKRN
ncbi:MAG: RNA polymerase II mediator complex subunit [Icmadophila ericetorum]|nr:RNA polymerase II mediator complex subunit [Icmadophila ericetorum]